MSEESDKPEQVIIVSPSEIAVGPFQPRKTFPKTQQAELVASVREKGIIQPLLVRLHPTSKTEVFYELVCGERRLRAAVEVKCKVPVIVKVLTDGQVQEIQLIENLQRADLTPIEEAEGYEKLQADQKFSAKEIAAKVGKSESYVYARLKLCALGKPGRKALADGQITTAVALVIARIPDETQQGEAVKWATVVGYDGGPRTLEQVSDHCQRVYMLRLRWAPFDVKDAKLVPEAGACTDCPKCTANDKNLFSDIEDREALCTDGACYQRKVDALYAIQMQAAEKSGCVVLDDKQAKKIFPYNTSQIEHGGAYVDYDGECYEDPKRRTLRVLLKKSELKPAFVKDGTGAGRFVLLKSEVGEALKACGHKFAEEFTRDAPGSGGQTSLDVEKKMRRKNEVGKRTAVKALAKVAAMADGDLNDTLKFWKLLCTMVIRVSRGSAYQLVAKRREAKPKGGRTFDGMADDALLTQMQEMKSVGEVQGLAVELLCVTYDAYSSHGGGYSESLKDACDFYGIDLKSLERETAKEFGKKKVKNTKPTEEKK